MSNLVLRDEQSPFKGLDKHAQPQAIELESRILGGLLFMGCGEMASEIVLAKLKPEHFFLERNARIYRTIARMASEGRHVDAMTVAIEMARMSPSQTEEIQRYFADELMEANTSPGMIDAYADIILEKFYRRQVINGAIALLDLATDEGNEAGVVRDYIESNLLSLLTQQKPGGRMLSDSMPEAFENLEQSVLTGVMPGIPTGFSHLNWILNGGFRRGHLIVVAGRPSMGKSAFAVGNLLPYIAGITNEASIVFSLEMSEEELIHRFWAARMRNPYAINRLDMQDDDWVDLGKAVSDLSDLKIVIDETPKVSIDYIKAESRRLKAIHGSLGCIVIDYLQIMEYGRSGNPVQAIGQITSSLKALAKELDTPVILLSQLSRGVESREDKRPLLSDLRDSGTIEQDANVVMFLYRDDYYNKDSYKPGTTEVIVAKNRGGSRGTAELLFDGPRTTFTDIPKESYD